MPNPDFVNLTPYTVEIIDDDGEVISSVKPSGSMALTAGDQLINVPDPKEGVVYIVLPAITEISDRDDLRSVEMDEANRSRRGNVRTHVLHWAN